MTKMKFIKNSETSYDGRLFLTKEIEMLCSIDPSERLVHKIVKENICQSGLLPLMGVPLRVVLYAIVTLFKFIQLSELQSDLLNSSLK